MSNVAPPHVCSPKICIGCLMVPRPAATAPSAVRHPRVRQLAQERLPASRLHSTLHAAASVETAPSADHLTAAPSRAVIIGGSVAGIFTAAVAAPFFDEVVILERDPVLPHSFDGATQPDGDAYRNTARARNGSPQFGHLHGFLKGGWDMANAFLPGLDEEAMGAGAVKASAMSDAAGMMAGQRLPVFKDCTSDLPTIQATRAVIEPALRRRLEALYPNVQLRSGCWVKGVSHGSGDAQGSVTGVVLKGGETLAADLVVDASGRLSKVQSWLAEGGYATPRSVEVNSGVGYSDAVFDVPPEVVERLGWKSFYARPSAPVTRGSVIMLVEGGRMFISAIGYNGDHPPAGAPGQREFLESLQIPEITDLMRHAKPLWEPKTYRGATNKRRFYEEITMPRNLVVLGDAVCVFNPAYGQGVTTAALQAAALQKQLQACAGASAGHLAAADLGNLSGKAQKDIAAQVDFPFQLATGEDLKYTKTKGERRPSNSPMQGMIADYFKDMSICAAQDEGMSLVLREVGHMVKPPQALFSPGIVAKVALYRLRRLIGRLRPSGVAQNPAAS